MIMSNATHTTNIHTIYDSPYFNNSSVIERKITKKEYSSKSAQEIYELLKDDISISIGETYPSSMIENDIINQTKELFGYKIIEIEKSVLVDDEDKFTVYTAIIDLEDKDYSILIDQEWDVSESLELYDKNIILRFL